MADQPKNETYPLHFALLIVGGLLLGTGLLQLYYSVGWTGGDLNSNFALVGFNAFDQISLLPASSYSFPLIVIGALMMIFANATAWKQTDGY